MFADPDTEPGETNHHIGIGSAPSTRTVCFIGSGELFSKIVLTTLEGAVERARAMRLPDVATFARHARAGDPDGLLGPLCCVVVDEPNAAQMTAMVAEEPALVEGIATVIAFENDGFARALIDRQLPWLVEPRVSLIPMNTHLTVWVNLFRLVAAGGHYLPPRLVPMAESAGAAPARQIGPHHPVAENPPEAQATGLTPREAEVLAMAADGAPNKLIAHALNLSEHTVKLHMHRVIEKLGVHNRTEAAAWLFRHETND